MSASRAILIGGSIAGLLDITQASLLFGWDIPKAIAAGLLGHSAFRGGAGMYVLGLALHFLIAFSWTAGFYVASRKLPFMTEYPLVCGLLYGMVVENVMNLVVLPLSALRARGPYQLQDLLLGLGVHMVVIGLPIAYSVRKFAPASNMTSYGSQKAIRATT
jgi:hypothetical protein